MPTRSHPLRPALLALALLAPAFLTGCGRGPDAARTKAADAAAGDVVEAVVVLPGGGGDDAFTTFLAPRVDAPVIARSDGIVREVRVGEGRRVARGTVLGRLDDDQERLEVNYMGALSAQADAELTRAERGAQAQVISTQTLEAARAKARAARADLDLARLALDRRTLRAPVAGVVWQVRAVAHRPVKTGDVLFRVTDLDRLQAELDLPAALRGRVRIGDPARLAPPGGETIAARVDVVSPIVDPATGRFHVVLGASRPGGTPPAAFAALVGQTVRAELGPPAPTAGGGNAGRGSAGGNAGAGSAGGEGVLPPTAHLERTGDALYAIKVDGGRARRVPVELGALRADGYEVLNGLAAGDLVLAEGGAVPADGAAVHARLRAGGPKAP